MMYASKPILILLSLSFIGCAAPRQIGDDAAAAVDISWQLIEQDYKQSGRSLTQLTLQNRSSDTMRDNGWAVYFNTGYAEVHAPDSTLVRIDVVNGDLFRLSPAEKWKDLAPGNSITISVLNRIVKNFTDVPKGFYFVSERYPQGTAVSFIAQTPPFADTLEVELAKKHFIQNDQILEIPVDSLPPIFPKPHYYRYGPTGFELDESCVILRDDSFSEEAVFLQKELRKVLRSTVKIVPKDRSGRRIILQKMETAHPAGYELTVDGQSVHIGASTAIGAFYGVQSFLNLLPQSAWERKQRTLDVKGLYVRDEPRFGHRALMLDVSRNFQNKEQVLKILDLMAMYKLNVLHFHINDDEGWRLEIPGLPELTDVGAKRGHTLNDSDRLLPSYGSGYRVDNKAGTGHYSRKDYIEILRYAKERHIRVIPEIETPGHARAAIKAMDARYAALSAQGDTAAAEAFLLRDLHDESMFRSIQYWDDNVIDVSLPSTYAFLEKVTDELIAMYQEADVPLTTIHFGGDEVPEGVWQKSPSVQRLLAARTDLSGVDDLWRYYFGKINTMLKSRNLYLSGWEEIGMKKAVVNGHRKMIVEPGFAQENFHVDVWNNLGDNADLAYRLANAGYQVVLTNVTNFYIDLAYNESYYEPGQYWGGYVATDKPFRFIPYNYHRNPANDAGAESTADGTRMPPMERLTEQGKKNIIGLQAPLWSEIITSEQRMEYLLLPKLFGLVERAWSAAPAWEEASNGSDRAFQQSWSVFLHTIGSKELPKLDDYNGGYLYRIPTVGIRIDGDRIYANAQLPGFTIRYSTDDSEPTTDSPLFEQGMKKSQVKALRVFNHKGRGGRTVKII